MQRIHQKYQHNDRLNHFIEYTVNIPLSDNGFWIVLQFAVRGGAMFHIGITEKTDVNK